MSLDLSGLLKSERKRVTDKPEEITIREISQIMAISLKRAIGEQNFKKLDILIHHQSISPLASIVVKSSAVARGRQIVAKLKEVLPRQSFEMPIQAAIGGTIVARETIKAFRKDVTAKLYGGDQTRKDKLLKKQKKGKKRMKQLGRVQIPQEAFLAVLKK